MQAIQIELNGLDEDAKYCVHIVPHTVSATSLGVMGLSAAAVAMTAWLTLCCVDARCCVASVRSPLQAEPS